MMWGGRRRASPRLGDADILEIADHDGHLRPLGSLGDEGKVLEEGIGGGRLSLSRGRWYRGDGVRRGLLF